MARNELWQTRLPDDVSEEVHDYMEDRNLSKSETVRRLITVGLNTEEERTAHADGGRTFTEQLSYGTRTAASWGTWATFFSAIATVTAYTTAHYFLTGYLLVAILTFGIGTILTYAAHRITQHYATTADTTNETTA